MAMKGNKTIPCIKASNNFPEQNNGLILHLIHRTETFDVDSMIYIYIYTHETYMYIFNFSYLKLVLLHTNIQNSIRLQENPTTKFGKRIPLLTKREGEVINTQKKWQTSCNAKHKKFIYSMLSLSFLLNLKSWKQQHPVTFFATHFFGFCLFNNPWFVYSTELKYWLQKFSSLQRRQQQA